MPKCLIVANRTVAGRRTLDAVRERHQQGGYEFHLVVPVQRPEHGGVIYDEAVRDAAQLRVDLATAYLGKEGIELTGEIGDQDPFTATMDALHSFPADEVIVSTLPETRSGWLRRDLIERIEQESGKPVHHVVTDPQSEGLGVGVTLVVANRTAGGEEMMDLLKQDAQEADRVFIAVVPQEGRDGQAARVARRRLGSFLDRLRENGILASGMIGDPDPFDAVCNALDLFTVDHVVISTLPKTKSGWLRADLVDRVRKETDAKVDHVESEPATEGAPA
jgi:hypothetical protein